MIAIEEYLPKALRMEAEFLRSRNPNEILSFPRDHTNHKETLIIPSEVMFQNNEKILVKAPVSEYLLKTYSSLSQLPVRPVHMQDPQFFFHRHDFFEFNYVYHGRIENRIEKETVIQDTRQLILMNPHAAHHTALLDSKTIYFNILVNRRWAEEIFSNLLSFDKSIFNFFLDSVYGLNNVSPYIIFENTKELNGLILEMIKEFYEDDIYCQQMLFSKLFELFILLSRQSASVSKKQSQEFVKSRISAELLSYLRINYAHISLEEASEHFGYTPTYFSRLIKKQTGKYFSEIIQDYKIKSACNYLSGSGLSTEKIAEILGYNDASYFSKAFQKKMGMSPKEYRSKQQGVADK